MSEWGPWIEHDGKGCPCVGMCVNVVTNTGLNAVVIAGVDPEFHNPFCKEGSWNWDNWPFRSKVIRYRTRKPRGLTILENLIADLPAPTRKVDA